MNNDINEKNMANNRLILIIFWILLVGLVSNLSGLISAVAINNSGFYYNIELYYNKGGIEIKNVNVEFSNEGKSNFNKDNSYYLDIVDDENKILEKIFFSIPNFVLIDAKDEQGNFIATNESGFKELKNVSFNVFASYYENGYQIIVYDKSNIELDGEFISQFSKTGFNKEDFINVETSNNFSEDRGEEKDIKNDGWGIGNGARKFTDNYKNYIIILSLILLILIIVLVYFLNRKK